MDADFSCHDGNVRKEEEALAFEVSCVGNFLREHFQLRFEGDESEIVIVEWVAPVRRVIENKDEAFSVFATAACYRLGDISANMSMLMGNVVLASAEDASSFLQKMTPWFKWPAREQAVKFTLRFNIYRLEMCEPEDIFEIVIEKVAVVLKKLEEKYK